MEDKITNTAGDVIALLRLTLVGDSVTSVSIVDQMDRPELMRAMAMSLGLAATALKMICHITGITLEEILARLVTTNEMMRNGDI